VVEPAKPQPLVQAREGANYLKNPRPAYPGVAQRNGWQGTALLRVQVTPKGKPGAIAVQRSSGRDVLDEAAVNAVKKWSFVPATQGGVAVGGIVTVPIVFKIQ
jgi:protein TonB